MVERWTRGRRLEHTREVLLDAAEDVFARRGFDGAALEEIAETAGYTRGAIYKHFGSKEELFLAVNRRFNERILEGFADLVVPGEQPDEVDLTAIAERWNDLQPRDPRQTALGMEFTLYLLRNPQARRRVAEQRRKTTEMIAEFIDSESTRLGLSLRIPALTLARILIATGDGLHIAGYLDDEDYELYEPFLELYLSAVESSD